MSSFVVTAAAGGIGTALVLRLLASGHRVIACDVSSRRLATLADAAAGSAGELVTRKSDVAEQAAADALASEAVERFGSVQGLANIVGGIAGIGADLIDRALERITLDEFRQSFRLNVDSVFLMTKALVPHFRANNYGKVANVASLAAFGNFDGMGNAAYDAAKAAVIGLTRTLSRSLGADGIRVNAVAPGSVYTERVRAAFSDAFIADQVRRIPLRRMPGPDDVAAMLEFLLLPASDSVSGEVVRVSGGLR